jgi:ABC-type dipeptide/oligopeptide/nickel transport system permease subunit
MSRRTALLVAGALAVTLALLGVTAPRSLPEVSGELLANAGPLDAPPFGNDPRGRPWLAYAQQGASVILGPAAFAAGIVSIMAVLGGLLRCVGSARIDGVVQAFGELLGALPRMVVVLVVALLLRGGTPSLVPLALTWALLSSPNAMDEAASVAERLGGARFVEALRAHGFSWSRIFLWHVVALNLRPVVVRQAAETVMQVTFLEIALSYLCLASEQPSITHPDLFHSWADILQVGYLSVAVEGTPTMHALVLGLGLLGTVTAMSLLVTHAARAR